KQSRYERRIRRWKRDARSELDSRDWGKGNFARLNFCIPDYLDCTERIDIDKVSDKEFIERFERHGIPVVITGATRGWNADDNWSPQRLLDRFYNEKFKVGEDDDGKSVHVPFSYFMNYCLASGDAEKDDSPLYIFDPNFGDRSRNNTADDIKRKKKSGNENEKKKEEQMLADYIIPRYFRDDLFQYTGSRRPPHRWVVIGPKRSGTGIHIDPLGTSAWNTLLTGHKRWALFPPEIPKNLVTMRGLPDHEAATWFVMVYPRLHDRSTIDHTGKTLAERLGIINIIQRPGETVFVPGGWHHLVINLDFTVGVTQNFCSVASWETVWLKTRNSRPKMGERL
ncbi:hypothetical protein BDR26DRAFT_775539, partial [Obelidium mucronatum]